MKFRFFILLLLLISFSCSDIPSEQEAGARSVFSTTVPSHLFFKNMRSSYYEARQQANTKVDLYKLRKIKASNASPLIYPVIADNWMKDEAYLLIQTNDYPDGLKSPLTVHWSGESQQGLIEMGSPANFQHQYAFALELEKVLKRSIALEVVDSKGQKVPFLESYEEKSWFLTTLRDYKKLIEQ